MNVSKQVLIEVIDGLLQLKEMLNKKEIDKPFFDWSLEDMYRKLDKYISEEDYKKHDFKS